MSGLEFTPATVFREEPEGGILFDVDTGSLKLVEGVAWGIAAMIDRGASRAEILRELMDQYPDETNLEADLDSFLNELVDEHYLQSPERGGTCS